MSRPPRSKTPWIVGIALLVAAGAVVAWQAGSGGAGAALSAAERGKLIYTKGQAAGGHELTVSMQLFGGVQKDFPARRYACINCHTGDGLVSIEGGVTVPSIQPHVLATATQPGNGTGRIRLPYDEASLRRAITMGVDSSGNRLNTLMPRFNLSDDDLADLLAYLAKLGIDEVPGVTAKQIRVVTVLDEQRFPAAAVTAVRETLQAFVAENNQRGGVFGRDVQLDVLDRKAWQVLLGDAERQSSYLCALAPLGALDSLPKLPVLGIMQPDPLLPPKFREGIYHLYPSQLDQARVAIDHYCDVLKKANVDFRLMLEDAGDAALFQKALAAQVEAYPGSSVRVMTHDPAARLPAEAVVLLVGTPEFKNRVLAADGSLAEVAVVYASHLLPPGALNALAPAVAGKLRLLLPIPLPDPKNKAVVVLRSFLARHKLPESFLSHRIASFTAAAAFVECLKRCGSRVTRSKLIKEARALYKFQPGLFPPLTFGPNRSTGAIGAQVVRYDQKARSLVPMSAWREPK